MQMAERIKPKLNSKRWPFERKLSGVKNLGLIGSVWEAAILTSSTLLLMVANRKTKSPLLFLVPKPTTFKEMRLLPSTSTCTPLIARWQLPSLLGRAKLFSWRRAIGGKTFFRMRKIKLAVFSLASDKAPGQKGSPSLSSKNVGILFKKILSISSRNFIPMVRFLGA